MAVIETFENGWLISHQSYLEETYKPLNKKTVPEMFSVKSPFMMDLQAARIAENRPSKSRKRKRSKIEVVEQDEQVNELHKAMASVLSDLKSKGLFLPPPEPEVIKENNKAARGKIKQMMSEDASDLMQGRCGSNQSQDPKIAKVNGKTFLLPSKSEYYVRDVQCMSNLLIDRTFQLIIIDPPWENRFIKRSKTYGTLGNEDIFESIPIPDLLDKNDGCLVIWCTNSSRHQSAVKTWLSRLGLQLRASWYWLKVTLSGEPITPLDPEHDKKPYELILIATTGDGNPTLADGKIIVSTPSIIHSHKPPLSEVLKQAGINTNSSILEIFARYLLPNQVSFGNQALRFQESIYFT